MHQHSHAQRKARQRDDVQRHICEIHQRDGTHQAERDAARHNKCGLCVLEEKDQHDDGQQAAPQQIGKDAAHHHVDVVALIHQRRDVQARVLLLQLCDGAVDALAHRGRGRRALLLERQHHAVVAVHLGIAFARVVRQSDIRHIGQAHIAHAVHIHVHQ